MSGYYTFRRGQLVEWIDSDEEEIREQIDNFRALLGDGPFRVSRIVDFDEDDQEKYRHHQALALRYDRDLRRVRDDDTDLFSAFFFKPVNAET